jgi:hypothetical protein
VAGAFVDGRHAWHRRLAVHDASHETHGAKPVTSTLNHGHVFSKHIDNSYFKNI